jgi:hypothetical protein
MWKAGRETFGRGEGQAYDSRNNDEGRMICRTDGSEDTSA